VKRSGASADPVVITRLVVVGYILAFSLPPLGFGFGIVLTFAKSVRSKHGPWIALLSIVGGVIWAVLISGGALTATNQSY
jgi:hypothetical protein